MITRAIEKAFANMKNKGWEKTYWAFDIHETIIEPNWQVGNIPRSFYPMAKEALQLISEREDIVKILYTCSYPSEVEEYLAYFKSHDIHFDYVNENPEVSNSGFGYYEKKPYFNVLFEDKSGFEATEDWYKVMDVLSVLSY